MRHGSLIGLVFISLVSACAPGSGTYCQTGPRYGTQCYAEPDVRQPPGAPRPVPESPRKGEPPANPPNKLPW